jgi:hypothetical protein
MKLSRIVALPNPDKLKHENYYKGRSPANIPKPFVLTCTGRPGSGKTNLVLNIIASIQGSPNKKEKFDEIYVCHGAIDQTKEYEILDATDTFTDIPHYSEFDQDKKTLIIFDDIDFTKISKDELKRLSELVRFGSTHFNICQIYCNQNFFKIPSVIRQNSNCFITYKPSDRDELNCIGRRIAIGKKTIKKIFDDHNNFRDSLFVDMKPGAPHMYYINLFTPLTIEELD